MLYNKNKKQYKYFLYNKKKRIARRDFDDGKYIGEWANDERNGSGTLVNGKMI